MLFDGTFDFLSFDFSIVGLYEIVIELNLLISFLPISNNVFSSYFISSGKGTSN
ncbi:hypothetical protein CDL12_04862 [Handroanthus impetiginosus]|uniref:Uncharacterized protein n=1 Tax=Handroanthus impetiginosus TaxID=429701 RepID=A0A2G9HY33_9LAMI|nr:hypothetical protein CDL12_04862 [Handroanthus impetiginosus]